MDSEDLVARENEFKKLNKQLEKKTQSLMKEIEHAMQRQDVFQDFSPNLRLTPSPRNLRKHCCDSTRTLTPHNGDNQKKIECHMKISNNKEKDGCKSDNKSLNSTIKEKKQNTCETNPQSDCNVPKQIICPNCLFNENSTLNNDLEFLYAFVSINVDEKILPQTFLKDVPERVTVERVCKFLSAKVKLMQEQLIKMQSDMDKKTSQCEGHLTQLASVESERLALVSKANSARADAADLRAKCAALQTKLEEKDCLYKEQRSVAERLAAEARRVTGQQAALEARCAAHQLAAATLKQQLDTARMAEKEFRESSRALSASNETSIRQLEARARALAAAVHRQNSLIDNLRRQHALLAAQAALRTLDADYAELLNKDL